MPKQNSYSFNCSISTLIIKLPWVAVIACLALVISNAIVNTQWIYLALLVFLLFFIYIFQSNSFLILFGLYAFLLPLDAILLPEVSGAVSGLIKYLGFLIILVLCVKGAFENKFRRPDTTVVWWVLLSSYSLLTLVWAINEQPALDVIRNVIAIPLFYLIVSSYKANRHDYEMLKLCIIGGGVVLSLLIIHSYGTLLQSGKAINRVSIMVGDNQFTYDNLVAFSLLLPVSMSLEKILHRGKRLKKLLYIFIVGAMLMGIVLSGSRGGMLGASVIFVVYFLLSQKRITFLTYVIPLVILILSFAPSFLLDRWEIAAETGGAGRVPIWQVGLKALEKYWLTGAGLNSFPAAFTEFVEYSPRYVGIDRGAHNLYLGMFVELGILGFALMIIGFVKHYRAIDRVDTIGRYDYDSIMLIACFWSLLTASFFLDTFWFKEMWLLWTLIMIRKNALKHAGWDIRQADRLFNDKC